jgi:hypothetical protein
MNRVQFKNFCDECESVQEKLLVCLTCEQTICLKCDTHVHNKGNRLKHIRLAAHDYFYRCAFNKNFVVYFLSFSVYRDYFWERKKLSERICRFAYERLVKRAKAGKPMMLFSKLKLSLENEFGKNDILQNHLEECLLTYPVKPLFHKTERNLGQDVKVVYFSICLDEISVESLLWIIRSIFLDRMEPNQVLIQSRFKEYFALKIPMKEWNFFVKSLCENPEFSNKMNTYSKIFGNIQVVKNNDDNFIFKIKDLNWEYEDNSFVDNNDEDYIEFLKFLDIFFEETESELFKKFFEKEKIGLSSVKNSKLRKNSNNSQNKLKTLLKTQNIKKAIPGGMYGCVLLLKSMDNKIFNSSSMGRLHALIKKALKDQVIIHYKTLIIKEKNNKPINEKTKQYLIEEAKKRILIILEESGNRGITLAQMHNFLIKRFGKKYDFPKLGFPKLKNFLMTIDGVFLDHGENINHIKAKLKYKYKTQFFEDSLSESRSLRDTRLNRPLKSTTTQFIESTPILQKPSENREIHKKWNKEEESHKQTDKISLNPQNKKKDVFRKWNDDCAESDHKSTLSFKNESKYNLNENNKDFIIENFILNMLENSKNGIEMNALLERVNENFGNNLVSKNTFEYMLKNMKNVQIKQDNNKQQIINFMAEFPKSNFSLENSLISDTSRANKKMDSFSNSENTNFRLISGFSTPGSYNQQFGTKVSFDNNPFSSLNRRDFSNGFNQFNNVFDLSPHYFDDLENEEDDELNHELDNMVIKNINSILDDNN